MARETVLVAVTDDAATRDSLASWLSEQLPQDAVTTAAGFYAGVAAIERGDQVIVIDVGTSTPRQEWQVAELRSRLRSATVAVVASARHLPALAGALRADLALTSTDELPPLRELLLATEPALTTAQTNRRRSTR